MNLQDGPASFRVGSRDADFPIETARPAKRRVDHFRNVGRADHENVTAGNRAVHEGEKLRHDPLFHVPHDVGALRGDGVDFIDEDHARRLARRLLEYLTQSRFAVAVKFLDDFRPVDLDEVQLRLRRDRAGDEGLPGSRRSVEEQPLRRLDAQPVEEFPVAQRNLHHLPDGPQLPFQAADIFVGDAGVRLFGVVGFVDLEFGVLVDDDRAGGRRPVHGKEPVLATEERNVHLVAGNDRQPLEELPDVADLVFVGPPVVGIDRGEHDAGRRLPGRLLDPTVPPI